ncbi:peptidase domain-containing ABC transporter [Flavobacterium psychrophilum]|uniref:Peptidase domain-containing ABC transporter n=1 Tax=Flavobacterium psychrophilum TaxID=96345 RepID=A0A7U2NEN3_FLAPS|nr:peptidase domain-containing ABC transporter [Flavobacterium psychrophilum]EKT4553123.1 peptidase domain-containing ABC transporter [Flavobacterium psychrophilum]ELM3643289.1 peptidase domain-containing ABC transporter [Flavobacterium psychrophilum]MBF2092157.1 peptidase domain-containing ABC transporter [Flavobacterium psychrophilum]OAE91742.1 ABC transporter ATP-binding protein [Flavobacterium psychrophilum]OJH13838.1 ABC transporter ATP-binding protein [Flavobacterium psychrophilum]
MRIFPNYIQADSKDCGATCLKIIGKYYGKTINIQELRQLSETTREGSNLLTLSDAAEKIGFRTLGAKLNLKKLEEVPLPCILHWNNNHYVILYKIKKGNYYISDPAHGLLEYNETEILKFWIGNNANSNTEEGVALLLEPTPKFYQNEFEKENKKAFGFSLLFKYIFPYKSFVIQLIIGLLAGSLLQLIFPFLTQSIVDVGIQNQNINFIYLILFAQLFLFFGKTALELIRSWILLHLSTRINISLISDFFIKLMNLPISFFDVRMTGDIMQRINDHHRIERILTTSSLNVLFSLINMFIMGGVLAYYNLKIFVVFFIGSLLYFFWVILFLKRREALDYKRFAEVSQEQSKVMELINGMQEIKLHNAEKQKRWGWEYIQARLFKVSMKGLVLEQTQNIGSNFINELKNIIIIFLSAKLVIDGQITLGMMLAISSIVGSLNAPVLQLINFIREAQDAKISLARLSEIHEKEDEIQQEETQSHEIPKDADIVIKDLSFRYIGSDIPVLEGLNLTIPANKVTAIVGTSGSGKTTLMKLLLKFYEPNSGTISLATKKEEIASYVAMTDLKNVAQKTWRSHVGTVMQEGYIFNDTIANNIAIGVDIINKERLVYASDVANIAAFIQNYPLGYNTKIGMEGVGMSTGQKQRLLIARSVYKNPEMLFFDEATSALDANNEKEIMQKLDVFFKNKTVVVIAHRLSTVMNADQIVVLEKGKIIEIGNHNELVELKGSYYELVRNQLQLGT